MRGQAPQIFFPGSSSIFLRVVGGQSRKRVTAGERRRNRVKILNSRFKPPSILASWLVNTTGFNNFIIGVLVLNAVIIGIDVECTLHWPDSLDWLHLTVDIISIIGESVRPLIN